MDFQRPVLILAIAAVSLTLLVKWHAFQQDHRPPQPALPTAALDAPSVREPIAETGGDVPVPTTEKATPEVKSVGGLVTVETDTLLVQIDTTGGDLVGAALRDYPVSVDQPTEPFVMLTRTPEHLYIAQSGLIGANGTDTADQRPRFTVTQSRFVMPDQADALTVDLHWQDGKGITMTKRFTFTRGEHTVRVDYLIDNHSPAPWQAHFYGQIKRDTHEPVAQGGAIGIKPFLGAATSTLEHHFQKMTFKNMAEKPLRETREGGWIAMVQHYFVSAWIADPHAENQFYTTHQPQTDTYLLGFTGPAVSVAPGTQGQLSAQFYVGPKDVHKLEALAPYLDLTVDYGWLWMIAKVLFWLVHSIHGLVGNWGWAIIGLTVVVKAVFLWPSTLSYRSMAVMKKLAPRMQELKEQHGENPTRLREEMFKLYQKEKANPMLGCVPMLLQMPVFIALYWTLMESVELRQAPFVGWIVDLSVQDPYFLLPILMGVSMWVQQKLNPPAADPMQQKIFQMMPLVFTGMFLFFPSGLVLYMLVNNLISMTHQWWVQRELAR